MSENYRLDRYRELLLNPPQGARNLMLKSLCGAAIRAGLSLETAGEEICHCWERSPDEVARAWRSCDDGAQGGCALSPGAWKRPKEDLTKERRVVPKLIADGCGATFADLRAMSRENLPEVADGYAAAEAQLYTLFDGGDLIAEGAQWLAVDANGEETKRHAFKDLHRVQYYADGTDDDGGYFDPGRDPLPNIISLNTFSGELGKTSDGKASKTCKETVSTFRYTLLEADEMPLREQVAFCAGLIRSAVGRRVMSVTFSGGKSLHVVYWVGALGRLDYEARVGAMKKIYVESQTDAARKFDRAKLAYFGMMRLAGAWREMKRGQNVPDRLTAGRVTVPTNGGRIQQTLLYLGRPWREVAAVR